nr:type II toxin-antitoxin system YafQ family toxin [Clostridia bacterium]
MKLAIKRSNEFKRDVKRIIKRGVDLSELEKVVGILANGEALPEKY